jgi:hypothetical protein
MVLGEMELIAVERGEYMDTAGDVTLTTRIVEEHR